MVDQRLSNPKNSGEWDPTVKERYFPSYMARRGYKGEVQEPPYATGVTGTIDIHCHAHEGQQDPLALAKLASMNAMGGILYKSIVRRTRPAESLRQVQAELFPWCDEQKIEPIKSWAGWNVASPSRRPSVQTLREQLDDGVKAVWLPVNTHANNLITTGARNAWWDEDAPKVNVDPLEWEEALKHGDCSIDERGRLKPEIKEILALIADRDVALFYGHATHPEMEALTEEVQRLGIKKAVIDHPFSPFIHLSLEQMKRFAAAGVFLNFTYDELSGLMGVDPRRMHNTIKAVGVEHVTLSTDCGGPLLPNSVEGMRLICAHMKAFGMPDEDLRRISVINPGRIVSLN